MKHFLPVACIFFTFFLHAHSQTFTILDRSTSQPLGGALVEWSETLTTKPFATSIPQYLSADASGKVNCPDSYVPKDSDVLRITRLGYYPLQTSFGEIRNAGMRALLSEKSVELNEYVVSASRFVDKKRDAPMQIETIRSADIENMNQPTTAEMLSQSGKVFVQKSQLGGGSPVMRGFEASRVLIVVDGIRMNNAIFRAGHLQNVLRIDQNILDRTELVFGPGSVLYGSDALGGVLNFRTKNPVLADTKKFRHVGNAFIRYGSAMNEATGHVDVSLASRKFGSLTSVTYSHFGDLMQGNIRNPALGSTWDRTFYVKRINGQDSAVKNTNTNKQVGTGYRQYDILQKFVYRPDKKNRHTLNLQYSATSNVNRYDRLTETAANGSPRSAEWYYGPEKRLLAAYQFDFYEGPFYSQGRLTVAYQNIGESRHNRNFGAANRTSRIEEVNVGTVNLDFSKRFGQKHELHYGLEGTYNNVRSSAFRTNVNDGTVSQTATTRYPGGGSQMYSAAAYATHTWNIGQKLVFSQGIRFSYVGLDARFNDTLNIKLPFSRATQQNHALNGNLGLIYMPEGDWRFALIGATGFRAPNVDDLAKVFDSQPGTVIVPNAEIRPEYSANVDLNLSKTFFGRVRLEAVGYFTWLWDAISAQPYRFNGQDSILYDGVMSRVLANVNADHGFITGAAFNLDADITTYFSIDGSLGYTYGRLSGNGGTWVPLDHIPPVYGRLGATLKLKKFRGEGYVLFNGKKLAKNYGASGEDNIQYATPFGMPGWYTLNLRAAYSINTYLRVQVALENLLDVRYRYFASGVSAPGRNVTVTLRTRF